MTSPAGWHPDPKDPTLLRYWDGTQWTEQRAARIASPGGPATHLPTSPPPAAAQLTKRTAWGDTSSPRQGSPSASAKGPRRWIGVVAASGILVAISALVVFLTTGANNGSNVSSANGRSTPVVAMFDPTASQNMVIQSITTDYCKPKGAVASRPTSDTGNSMMIFDCSWYTNGTANAATYGMTVQVYSSAASMSVAVNAGVPCQTYRNQIPANLILLTGPSWLAATYSTDLAADLVARGAHQLTCN